MSATWTGAKVRSGTQRVNAQGYQPCLNANGLLKLATERRFGLKTERDFLQPVRNDGLVTVDQVFNSSNLIQRRVHVEEPALGVTNPVAAGGVLFRCAYEQGQLFATGRA